MAISCPGCGREYDVTLFQFGRTIHCTCGRRVGLEHRVEIPVKAERPRFVAHAIPGLVSDADCVAFLQWALPRVQMRWRGFRRIRKQVCKRLSRRLRELGLESLSDYRLHLEARPSEWAVLGYLCRITISRFYRDRAVFDSLRDPALPALGRGILARGDTALRCWSAGCASGEEPYSLRLAWDLDALRHVPGVELLVVATDIDGHLLERARIACYPPGSLRELPPQWITAAFAQADDSLCVRTEFRTGIEFVRGDICSEMPSGPFDLVLCRNLVFTYFEQEVQVRLLERMLHRLVAGGLLVLGGHEALPEGAWPLDRPYGALPIHRRVA